MQFGRRFFNLTLVAILASAALIGCGSKDPLDEAAETSSDGTVTQQRDRSNVPAKSAEDPQTGAAEKAAELPPGVNRDGY